MWKMEEENYEKFVKSTTDAARELTGAAETVQGFPEALAGLS